MTTHEHRRLRRGAEQPPFKPDALQKRLLATFAAGDADADDVGSLCAAAGVTIAQVLAWNDEPLFREWWEESVEAVLKLQTPFVLRALTARAYSGELAAIRMWLQRFNRIEPTDADVSVRTYRELHERFADVRRSDLDATGDAA